MLDIGIPKSRKNAAGILWIPVLFTSNLKPDSGGMELMDSTLLTRCNCDCSTAREEMVNLVTVCNLSFLTIKGSI